ncbi:hypothetical protein A3H26_01210 [candidate division WWE3 bacterium RIFCSPLOWO2_12_FULL_36_10]|uniref:YoaR-like putative peptidoglycan binding domain-containing protein n=1 Tax=candidate division WWE3 bacterium RIFCSPLOWO2_12_FULL_36_10 TaxID=1802630 RepID=A0A1F4VHT6_UNCKA|nr:MAG: hypothetical protein A3H26_01210 [candidate division WWE3 bacterium RIFCSPLOWO2_12_FULL_36_10]
MLNKISTLLKSDANIKYLRFAFIFFSSLILVFTLYHIYFAKRIIPGVAIGKVKVGGLAYDSALLVLQNADKNTIKKLTVSYKDKKYPFDASDIKLHYDLNSSIRRAFEVGRTGNFITDSKDKLAGFYKTVSVKAFYTYSDASLNNYFSQIKGELNVDPQTAKFVIGENGLFVTESVNGIGVEDQKLFDFVVSSIDNLDFKDYEVPIAEVKSEFSRKDLELVYSQVQKIIFNPLKLVLSDKSFQLNPEKLLSFISVVEDKDKIALTLNKANFEAYLDELSQEINELPRGEVTKLDGDKVVGFKVLKNGRELSIKKFTEDFKKAFFDSIPQIGVAVDEINEVGDPSKYGIYALLGKGVSKFEGSAPGRIHNLSLAAQRTHGVLVPPGKVYSFNNSVGEISGATGYDSAYIISNGRTILGEGGGVCQTSTTLFRAVLNSGLPVVMRYPHAYRVHYYEIESPVGLDASVYQPSLDFQFKNDTPNYVLVQSSVNEANKSLEFDLYGTPDGRKVEISTPVVSNQIAPPAALYKDDPTLAKGVTKQIDFSAWGATVSFNRKVTKAGKVLYDDTFSSRYQPWQAIFLVGTR